jgi:hypothetical protein
MEHLLFYFAVEDFLDQKFPQKWIGRGRPTTQPPPHLTPFYFFFWRHINPAFYVPTLCTPLLELAARIQADEATITPAMLKNVRHELKYIYDMSLTTHSAPTEHLPTLQCRSQKLDKRTQKSAFYFHSYASCFSSNTTFKSSTFQVFTLYNRYVFFDLSTKHLYSYMAGA